MALPEVVGLALTQQMMVEDLLRRQPPDEGFGVTMVSAGMRQAG